MFVRSLDIIAKDIEVVKQEIRYARQEGASLSEVEQLFESLEELENERHEVRTLELGLGNISSLQV